MVMPIIMLMAGDMAPSPPGSDQTASSRPPGSRNRPATPAPLPPALAPALGQRHGIHPDFLRLTRRLTVDTVSPVGATSVAHPRVDHRHALDRRPRAAEVAPTVPPAALSAFHKPLQLHPSGDPANGGQIRVSIRFASGSGRTAEENRFIAPVLVPLTPSCCQSSSSRRSRATRYKPRGPRPPAGPGLTAVPPPRHVSSTSVSGSSQISSGNSTTAGLLQCTTLEEWTLEGFRSSREGISHKMPDIRHRLQYPRDDAYGAELMGAQRGMVTMNSQPWPCGGEPWTIFPPSNSVTRRCTM